MGNQEILSDIKHLMGISEDAESYFDEDLIIHIASVLTILTQLGIGPSQGFFFTGTETWNDFIGDVDVDLSAVRSFVYLKVKLMFDPPISSSTLQAFKDLISELEWRLNVSVDPLGSSEV